VPHLQFLSQGLVCVDEERVVRRWVLRYVTFSLFLSLHLLDICVGKRKLTLRTTVQARNTIAMHTGPLDE